MRKPTLQELLHRVEEAITRNEKWIYDVAANTGSIGVVKNRRLFRCEIADHLIATTVKWSHLQAEVNSYREGK